MSKPAACLGDNHTCPMVTGQVPHVGGPIAGPGCPTVLIGGKPAAAQGDMCVCVGPPDSVAMGSSGVMFGGMPAARMGDQTSHGGVIVSGNPTVLIGESGGGGGGGGGGQVSEAEELELKDPDYIAIELKDDEGNGVPYAKYKVTLPDGSEVEGRLNANGYKYLRLEEAGDCKVDFLDINGTDIE